MFAEELVKVKQDLVVAQEYALTLERDKDRLAGELRLAKDRQGKAEERAEQAEKERDNENRRSGEIQQKLADHTVTVMTKDKALSDLTVTTKKLEETKAKLKTMKEERDTAANEADEAKQILTEKQRDFERAEKLIQAFRERSELDALISGT